ncbi:MAG: ABC transporter ATP-binding protein [Candidatus Eisenbacteria bacterium]
MLLELRDIWAAPPGAPHPAVRGVSLEVRAGEWVAVGGPNGCGKTTLLLVAAGLLEPRRGTRNLSFSPDIQRADSKPPRVATLLQDPSVQLFTATVAEEIGLTALHLGFAADRREAQVRRWSSRLGLDDDLGRAPQSLSAGRQQLVLLAAALATDPDLLIADEPGAHLDAEARRRVLEMLASETQRGLAILWATQDSGEWQAASRTVSLCYPDSGATGRPSRTETIAAPGPGQPIAWPAADITASKPGVGVDPPTLRPETRSSSDGGQGVTPFVILRVGSCPGSEGPCVRTDEPLELHLPRVGVVSFEGPNGAGKSVLLAAICGLLSLPQIRISTSLPLQPSPLLIGEYPERQVFEETVGSELAFAAVNRGVGRAEALELARVALSRLDMGARLTPDRHSWELSMGEKRLVLLVGALIAPAALLALDEPTAGLDDARRVGLAHLITERSRSGLVLIASQDSEWVRGLPGRKVTLAIPRTPLKSQQKNGLTETCEEH